MFNDTSYIILNEGNPLTHPSLEMESLAFGKSAYVFVDRLTRQRRGQTYDVHAKLLCQATATHRRCADNGVLI